jgi:hypothetical protein
MNRLRLVPSRLAIAATLVDGALEAAIEAHNNRAFQRLWRLSRQIHATSETLALEIGQFHRKAARGRVRLRHD